MDRPLSRTIYTSYNNIMRKIRILPSTTEHHYHYFVIKMREKRRHIISNSNPSTEEKKMKLSSCLYVNNLII